VQPLPIDARLPEIAGGLREAGGLVIVAEPGAGKTTRVPRALLDGGFADSGEIVVLEPRRLAARMAARRVAEELGERVGERIGYQVRFEEAAGPRTRVRFVTEGILARRLVADPTLSGIAVVVLDEFHERHLHADVALAAMQQLRRGARPDLRLLAMSATLDAEPIAKFLEAPVIRVEGRSHPVAIEHAERPDDRPLEKQVAAALRKLVQEKLDGDVLVFLPGAAEMRRAEEACAEIAKAHDLFVVMLHGELSPEEQDRAVRPAQRRKVILSTNVAETSVTIEGVVAVIDSGLARVAQHSPWSGLPTLAVAAVSRASAAQRAGRAGRTRPGRCIRLFTKHDHDARPAHEVPEIRRADLAETLLQLRASGIADPSAYRWFEPPPEAALAAADQLLRRLGAISDGNVTQLGRRMLGLPLHPRLARLLLEAEARGAGERAALLCALLGEREIRRAARGLAKGARIDQVGPSDLLERLEAFEGVAAGGLRADRIRAHDLDVGAVLAADRARKQIARGLGSQKTAPAKDSDRTLQIATLAAFPDRVAKRRGPRSADVVFAGGGSARLAETSVVRDAELLVAVEAEERKGAPPSVRLASAIEADWLLDLFPDKIVDHLEAIFDPASERVEVVSGLAYEGLILDESRRSDAIGPEVSRALAEAALAAGPARFCDPADLARLQARARFLQDQGSPIPLLDDEFARATLTELCEGRRSFADLREADLVEAMIGKLAPADRARLERGAPTSVTLPGGRRTRVEYAPGQPPWIESRLQDFFGLSDGPRVADGKVALVLHLLAPNGRAVQVTTDLAGFWERHYPSLRRELGRRYPRHAWPEDPLTASPPAPRRR
jgi:ATP-dependent helicase HrpB